MPLSDKLTSLADAVRKVTATSDKISVDGMRNRLTDFKFIRPNLLEHTKNWSGGTDYWSPTFSAYTIESEKDPYGNAVISCNKSWVDAAHYINLLTPGEYTFSCWIKLASNWDNKSNLHFYSAVNDGSTDWYGVIDGLKKGQWVHYVKVIRVFKAPVKFRIESDGNTKYYLGSYKLEKGNEFTGYTNLTEVGG